MVKLTGSVHRVFVDSSPNGQIRWFNETTNEIGKHRIGKGRGVHEAELSAVAKALEDNLSRIGEDDILEVSCDREVVVKQLNHKAGISEKRVLSLADKIWSLAYEAKQEKRGPHSVISPDP